MLVAGKPIDTGRTYLFVEYDRNDNLATSVCIARNVARKLKHIRHQHGLLLLRCRAAHAATEPNLLTGWLALERAKQQLLIVLRRVAGRDCSGG